MYLRPPRHSPAALASDRSAARQMVRRRSPFSTGTGTCTSAFTLGMQTATTGWLCNAWDPANAGTAETRETTVSTTAPAFTNYSIGTHPAATNFTASHTIRVTAYWGIGWIGVDRATKRVRPDLRVSCGLCCARSICKWSREPASRRYGFSCATWELRGGDIIVVANPDVIFRQYERPVFSATALPRFRPATYCTTRSQRPGESHLEFGGDIGWVLRFG